MLALLILATFNLSFQTTVETNGEPSRQLSLEWERVRCFDKEVATMFLAHVKVTIKTPMTNGVPYFL